MMKGYTLAIFASFTSAFYFIPYKAGISIMSPQTFTFGMFVASICLNGIPFIVRRKGLVVNRSTLIAAIVFGVLSYTGNLLNGLSLQNVSPPVTSVILRTQIFMIMIMGSFFLKEHLSPSSIIGAIIAVIGVATMTLGGGTLEVIKTQGIFFAALAALSFATVQIVNKYYIKEIHPLSLNLIRISIALLISAIVSSTNNEFTSISATGWLYCFIAAAFGTTISRLASIKALNFIPVSKAAIFSTLTPVFTTLLTLILLGDSPTGTEISGGVIVIIGVLIPLSRQLLKGRRPLLKRKILKSMEDE